MDTNNKLITNEEFNKMIYNNHYPILLGNGFSTRYDEQFFQKNLLKQIQQKWETVKFEDTLMQVFKSIPESGYSNFEYIWYDTQKKINYFFKEQFINPLLDIHDNLHCPEKIEQNANFLCKFSKIYTLNYDLILPWTIMYMLKQKKIRDGFVDGIWKKNDLNNIFFLHGALHIYGNPVEYVHLDENGELINLKEITTCKVKKGVLSFLNSIKLVRREPNTSKMFLEVFGGTWQEKHYYIMYNKYLKDCYENLKNIDQDTIIIYGCSLAYNDKHIWDVLNEHSKIENIYISIYIDPKDELSTTEMNKNNFIKNARDHLLSKNLYFFDADTISSLKNN